MTEELKQKAEIALNKRLGTYGYVNKDMCYKPYTEGYIDGATESTKELQEENLKLEAKVRTLEIEQNYCLPNCSKIADLENKLSNVSYQLEGREVELKELNKKLLQAEADYDKMFWQKNEIISNLKAQIEKMKYWCNCKNYQQCLIELAEQGKGMKPSECCVNCKKWEIKEK